MQLAEALKEGLVDGIPKPERHIETWLSDIFLYEDVGRKVTKHVSDEAVGDFVDPLKRKNFYRADFAWNNLFAPEIYTSLEGMREINGGWKPSEHNTADDFFILMNRIDADDTLINRLWNKKVTKEDVVRITEKLLINLDRANEKYFDEQNRELGKSVYERMIARLSNFRDFARSASGISQEVTDSRANALVHFHASHPYFKKLPESSASVTIDGHSANIVFIENKPVFMDVYWPMPAFRIVDHALATARIAACVRIFGGDELAGAMYDTYRRKRTLPPKEILDFYEAYNAFVMGYYFTHIKRHELIQPYFIFADARLSALQA
ncbi:hypothetical protein HY416_03775 [Candidatus Kaiserbacteria bacterium]|nr:hypothetical protein [Candidatus Kaiserbacteria bacterium]